MATYLTLRLKLDQATTDDTPLDPGAINRERMDERMRAYQGGEIRERVVEAIDYAMHADPAYVHPFAFVHPVEWSIGE